MKTGNLINDIINGIELLIQNIRKLYNMIKTETRITNLKMTKKCNHILYDQEKYD